MYKSTEVHLLLPSILIETRPWASFSKWTSVTEIYIQWKQWQSTVQLSPGKNTKEGKKKKKRRNSFIMRKHFKINRKMKRKTASKVFFVSIRGKAPLAPCSKANKQCKKKVLCHLRASHMPSQDFTKGKSH